MAEGVSERIETRKPGRPRKYSDAQRAEALTIYAAEGPAAAQAATGITKSLVTRWAQEAERTRAIAPTVMATAAAETEVIPLLVPSSAEDALAQTRAHVEQTDREKELRQTLRVRWLEIAHEALNRTSQPHTDFKGKDAVEVLYPVAPDSAFRNYVVAAATALDKYRLEVGEANSRTTIDFNAHIAAIAANLGMDPVEVQREAQALLNDGNVVAGVSARVSG